MEFSSTSLIQLLFGIVQVILNRVLPDSWWDALVNIKLGQR